MTSGSGCGVVSASKYAGMDNAMRRMGVANLCQRVRAIIYPVMTLAMMRKEGLSYNNLSRLIPMTARNNRKAVTEAYLRSIGGRGSNGSAIIRQSHLKKEDRDCRRGLNSTYPLIATGRVSRVNLTDVPFPGSDSTQILPL